MSECPVNNARKTRGRPFPEGNSGRPRGARNRRTVLVEALMARDVEKITESVIAAALGGDMIACRIVLDRICPARKGNVVTFKASGGRDAESVSETFSNLISATARGEVSPEEAVSIANVLTQQLKVVETAELEERMRALEAQLAATGPRMMRVAS